MALPPNCTNHVVTAKKLEELFAQNDFKQKLLQCRSECEVQKQDHWLDSQHKKEITRYLDAETGDEVAVIVTYTDHPPSTKVQVVILRLRIYNDIYDLRLL